MTPPPLARIQSILLKPRDTWAEIARESPSVQSLFTGYVVWLAAIPALAGFIGTSLIGTSVFGVTVRVPLLTGLTQMLVSYVFSLVSIGLLAFIIQSLAPRYGGVADRTRATQVAAYSATAAFLGGVFALLPTLAALGLLAGLYSLYLLYLGLPLLMQSTPEKSLAYTVVTVIAAVLLSLVVGFASSLLLPRSALPGGDFSLGSERSAEVLAERAAKAAQSGDPEDLAAVMAGAAGMVGATVAGGEMTPEQLQQMAEAMIGGTRKTLREAASAEASPSDNAAPEPTISEAPAEVESTPPSSAYGIGKRKLPAPQLQGCMSEAEINQAAFGNGCDCSCEGYAQGASRNCIAACGLSYYACWAPDPSDAELAANLDDATRSLLQQLPPEQRGAMRDSLRYTQMLDRAQQWQAENRCPDDSTAD